MNYQSYQEINKQWHSLSFSRQMAIIGNQLEKALFSKEKASKNYYQKELFKTLQLLELTITDSKNKKRLSELIRTRELLVDYFLGKNTYCLSKSFWQKYFYYFAFTKSKTN